MEKTKKGSGTTDLTVGRPLTQILKFALPLVLGTLFQQLYSFVDTVIVGRCLGTDALGAVGTTYSLNFLILGFVLGSCTGFGIPVAQSFGARDSEDMHKEEEHVSIYVHLQNMRYHDSISFISDIPDELMEYQIPKLTLQPVIENSILHGILEKTSKSGTIVLTGWMEDGDIVLLISDDGVGIAPDKLPVILSGEGTSISGGTNIAIYNTHRRLQVLYGADYGLTYSSDVGKGTEVQIRIPAKKDVENK